MRNPLVVGNWKLNGSCRMIKMLVHDLQRKIKDINRCIVAIAPPEIYLDQVRRATKGSNILLCAQNVDINLYGAFTGDTSANMLKDIGVKYIIIGHSERRIYHKESNEIIAKKFSIIKSQGLIPVLCIGESAEENAAGKTKEVCMRQIECIIKNQGVLAFKNIVIAYEPIWAIGTGKSATPAQVQEVHKFIRGYFAEINAKIADQIIIQYGGSVNASNAVELFKQPDIDGALVGAASLKADIFAAIVKAAEAAKK